MCLQIPLRTGSVSKPGLVGYGHGSQGDTLSLQSTHCDDGRDGAAGWDSAYTWGWKRLFPRCKSLCNSYLDMGLSMPAQERQPMSKVCKATDGGWVVCLGAHHEPTAGLAGALAWLTGLHHCFEHLVGIHNCWYCMYEGKRLWLDMVAASPRERKTQTG